MSGTTPFVACQTPLMMARSDLASAMRELQIAHQIILNALTVMDAEAKRNWIQLNERTASCDDGGTRYHERMRVIREYRNGY